MLSGQCYFSPCKCVCFVTWRLSGNNLAQWFFNSSLCHNLAGCGHCAKCSHAAGLSSPAWGLRFPLGEPWMEYQSVYSGLSSVSSEPSKPLSWPRLSHLGQVSLVLTSSTKWVPGLQLQQHLSDESIRHRKNFGRGVLVSSDPWGYRPSHFKDGVTTKAETHLFGKFKYVLMKNRGA